MNKEQIKDRIIDIYEALSEELGSSEMDMVNELIDLNKKLEDLKCQTLLEDLRNN